MDIKFELEPLTIRSLQILKGLLKSVLFCYTVLFGSLLIAGWTTYFLDNKQ